MATFETGAARAGAHPFDDQVALELSGRADKIVPMQHADGFPEQVVPIDSLPEFLRRTADDQADSRLRTLTRCR